MCCFCSLPSRGKSVLKTIDMDEQCFMVPMRDVVFLCMYLARSFSLSLSLSLCRSLRLTLSFFISSFFLCLSISLCMKRKCVCVCVCLLPPPVRQDAADDCRRNRAPALVPLFSHSAQREWRSQNNGKQVVYSGSRNERELDTEYVGRNTSKEKAKHTVQLYKRT